jgi:hypothetical protein
MIHSRVWALLSIGHAIQSYLHIFRCNRPAFRLTLIPTVTLFRKLYRETRRFLRVNISMENSVTSCISMRTLIKLRKHFFPSCIIGFRGTRFTRVCRFRRHSRQSHIHSDLMRPRLFSTLPFAAPRIFDNCIKST